MTERTSGQAVGPQDRDSKPRDRAHSTRLGPRPLLLHLAAANLTWWSSLAALPALRSGSLPWRPSLAARGASLQRSLAAVAIEDFAGALQAEILRRQSDFLDGVEAYRKHPFRRGQADPPLLWQEGTTRLLDYGFAGAEGPPLLVVPSLINRAYILDLTPGSSLMRWLARRGFRPLLVDWGRPGPEERGFGLDDYILGRLGRALEAVQAAAGRPPAVIGYCMGGLLALALGLHRPGEIAGLALMATPWDFHAGQAAQGALAAQTLAALAPVIDALGELPVDAIQAFFAALDPQLALRKFLDFAATDGTGAKAEAFVALEDWLNDGVPLAAPVAHACLAGWYGANSTVAGTWRIGGRVVDPRDLALPSLCVIPSQDRIVPPASARALAEAIPGAEILAPLIGHIGMVVSARAQQKVWRPLADWLKAQAV